MDILVQTSFSDSSNKDIYSVVRINSSDAKRILTYRNLINRLSLDFPELVSMQMQGFDMAMLSYNFYESKLFGESQIPKLKRHGFIVLPDGAVAGFEQRKYSNCSLHAAKDSFYLTALDRIGEDSIDIRSENIVFSILTDNI